MIVANKWMRAGYGERVASFLRRTGQPLRSSTSVTAPIFPDADTFPCILLHEQDGLHRFRRRTSPSKPRRWVPVKCRENIGTTVWTWPPSCLIDDTNPWQELYRFAKAGLVSRIPNQSLDRKLRFGIPLNFGQNHACILTGLNEVHTDAKPATSGRPRKHDQSEEINQTSLRGEFMPGRKNS